MKKYIVVIPYEETARLFHASRTIKRESFIGPSGIVYYESQAAVMDKQSADAIAYLHYQRGDAYVCESSFRCEL